MPVGNITRGTTNPNRLRRVDRWLQTLPALRHCEDPLVVDLGFGAKAVTTLELATRLAKSRTEVHVLGIEIDPERVRAAEIERAQWCANPTSADIAKHVSFSRGGFEVPTPTNRKPIIIRAFNVLRQYDETEVHSAWQSMQSRLQPQGIVVDGTCDELGRISSWISLSPTEPSTLTISLRLNELALPSIVAERLPKALIHHNVPGERIHTFLSQLDAHWINNVSYAAFGAQQRWIRSIEALASDGWPIHRGVSRWRLGEVTVDYCAVAPGQ